LPRRNRPLFTAGEVNKIIDAILHPAAKWDMRYWALDTIFHAFVDQNPSMSAEKFIR
jgi:hypothetical protein